MAVFISTPSQPSSIATAASRGGADAGIDQHRHAGALDDQPDRHPVLDAEPRADRRAQRHDRDRAGLLELLRGDRIVDAIDHRLEAFRDQDLGRPQRLAHVGIERLRLAQHFQLDQLQPPASRASRSVRIASSAVKQPAVLGR